MNAARPNPIAPTGLADLPAAPEPRSRADAEPMSSGGAAGVRRLAVVLAAAALGVLATTAHAQTPRFDLVGKFDGSVNSYVLAVTDNGLGGGFSVNLQGRPVSAFTWTPHGGRLDRSTPFDSTMDFGNMNRRLDRVALRVRGDLNAWRHTFDGPSDSIPSVLSQGVAPTAISADGEYVVGWNQHSSGLRRPFIWDSTRGTRVLPARQGDNSEAFGVSDDGRFIVGRDERNNVGWIWDDETGYTLLPNSMNGGLSATAARAVSPNGRIIIGEGAAEVAPGEFRITPMRWIDGVPQSLGFIDGFSYGEATGMSDDGSVIVGTLFDSNFVQVPFAWTQDRGMSVLVEYLADMGVPLPSNTLGMQRPTVSANGLVFGGSWWAEPASQTAQGFIAVVPGTSSLALVAVASVLSHRRRRP